LAARLLKEETMTDVEGLQAILGARTPCETRAPRSAGVISADVA